MKNGENMLATLPGKMVPGLAVYIQDAPIVRGDRGERLTHTIQHLGDDIDEEVYIVSPYLIPPASMLDAAHEATARGVDVTFLTASMAANNHTMAHSHYKKYRKRILRSGAKLYEFKEQPSEAIRAITDVEPVTSSFVSLHIKAMVEDESRVYLGSMNLDPRAMKINTENMIVIESPQLAIEMMGVVQRMLEPENAWQLMTNEYGSLRWKAGDQERRTQPARSFFQRLSDVFFRLLPLEGQL